MNSSLLVERTDLVLAQYGILPRCQYETPESYRGACDGGVPCLELGTIRDYLSAAKISGPSLWRIPTVGAIRSGTT